MKRDKLEPMELPALEPGCCDYCGAKTGPDRYGNPKLYCNAQCRQAYNNICARQGRAIIKMAKLWRKHRGRAGTPAEGMMGDIATRVDQFLAEDRQRKATFAEDQQARQ